MMMRSESKATFSQLPIEHLQRGRYQPRKHFNPEKLKELADSIAQQGILQPIVVREIDEHQYEILMGERRWRAAQLVRLERVPCLIRRVSEADAAEIALIENIQRENLTTIEEAEGLKRLVDDFGYTHEELAAGLGKQRETITNYIRLNLLDDRVKRLIDEDKLSGTHGKYLLALPIKQQFEMALRAVKNHWTVEALNVQIKQVLNPDVSMANQASDPNVRQLEKRVAEHLGATVKIKHTKSGKGQMLIQYSNIDILDGVCNRMGLPSEENL